MCFTYQYEYLLQQSPNLLPKQLKPPVAPFALPQRALVDTLTEDEGEAAVTVAERVVPLSGEGAALDDD
jgi:hypothetical protein